MCWVCDYRGRNIRRVIRRFGSYLQLQKWDSISGRADLERFADLFNDTRIERGSQKVQLPEQFISLTCDKPPATGRYAMKYLDSRGVTKADILKWKIGFCFDGEFRNRIIIPSFDEDGDCSAEVTGGNHDDNIDFSVPIALHNFAYPLASLFSIV